MLLLAIDTAGPNCAAAVARTGSAGPEILARAERRIGRGHADVLMPMIESVLQESDTSYRELRRIAVTTGPGSFTGVRVGVAATRGLALALGISAIGIGSLTALAFPIVLAAPTGTVLAALNAGRGDLCVRIVDIASGKVLTECAAMPVAHAVLALRQTEQPWILTGAPAPALADAVNRLDVRIAGTGDCPDIADVAALGLIGEESGPPTPIYARAADARSQTDSAVARL